MKRIEIIRQTISPEDLRKRPLSYSRLKHFMRSPLHFTHAWHQPYEVKAEFVFGNLVDCLILTPDDYEKDFVIIPEINKRTNAGKAEYAEFIDKNKGKHVITEGDLQRAQFMVASAYQNPMSRKIIDNTTRTQRKMLWTDKKTGLDLVGYTDGEGEIDGKPFVWDLKTTTNASEDDFMRTALKFNYPLQAGTYYNGWIRSTGKFPDYYIVAIEKTEPYATNVFLCSADFLELGKKQYREALDKIKHCLDEQSFDQGYEYMAPAHYNTLDLPGWAKSML